MVEDLRDAEPPWESQDIEPPSKTVAFDVEEGVQPPRHTLVEDLEEVEIEEAYKEVEVVREEHKGVELAISLEIPPPKLLSSFTTFKWVKFISLSFLIPLEYGLLETDGQLRALCGIKSKRKMVSGKNCPARFIMVRSFKFKHKGWCRAQLNGSGKLFGRFSENSKAESPGWNHDNQLEDGCRNKIWDPGGHWKSKHWWQFQDEFKRKPP